MPYFVSKSQNLQSIIMKRIIFISLIFCLGCKSGKHTDIVFPNGGYAFPGTVKDSTFPFYPVKDLLEAHDSFYTFYYTRRIMTAFDEPILSPEPAKEPVFRLFYLPSAGPIYFITLKEHSLEIKKSLNHLMGVDDSILSETERMQKDYLDIFYPLQNNKVINNPRRRKKADSLLQAYPQMADPLYYKKLLDKYHPKPERPFRYSDTSQDIAFDEYRLIVDELNKSGYWKCPVYIPSCDAPPTDGAAFILEANDGKKYNYVSVGNCTKGYDLFLQACQRLIDFAGLSKEVEIPFN